MSEKYGEIPKDLKGKIGHYWYYYKWMIIAGICVAGLIILFLVQVVFKTRADYTIILGMDTYVMDEQVEPIREMCIRDRSRPDVFADYTKLDGFCY